MADLVLGVDLGTSYFKLGLYDHAGNLRGLGRVAVTNEQEDHPYEFPVDRFWDLLREGLGLALEEAGAKAEDILALSYSAQANSFLLLDAQNNPLTPLILWPDQRAHPLDERVNRLWNRKDFLTTTGLGIAIKPAFAIAKFLWFQEHHPALWAQTSRIQTLADYFVFSLIGTPLTDEGTSSFLGLWDLQRHHWWDEGLSAVGIKEQQLSTPLHPGAYAGRLTVRGAGLLGLNPGVPFTVGSLDHHMAALGAGVGTIAPVSVSLGTVVACLRYLDTFSPMHPTCLGPGFDHHTYYQLAFNPNGASVLESYQKTHAPELTIGELSRRAGKVPPGCEGLAALPPAHTHSDHTEFSGVTDTHHHGHYARAIMESVAGSLAELLHQLFPHPLPARIVATGGGAKSDVWLNICAERTGMEFVVTPDPDTACRAAGLLAACAINWYPSVRQACASWVRQESSTRPPAAEHSSLRSSPTED